jgi:uncharacterized protein YkwD
MLKRISALLPILLVLALTVQAQDAGLPGLPPLPGDNSTAAPAPTTGTAGLNADQPPTDPKELKKWEKQKEKDRKEAAKKLEKLNKDRKKQGLEPLTALTGSEATTAASTSSALPALPGESNVTSTASYINQDIPPTDPKELKKWEKARAQKKKDDEKKLKELNKERKKQGLGPLTALPGSESAASETHALPALPGEGSVAAATPTPEVTPGEQATKPKPKSKKQAVKKWHPPDFGPNVIFGGWIKPKGADLEERLAWASQEVLNTLDRTGYQFVKETGVYAGENAPKEWREFSFTPRKRTKTGAHPVTVYVGQSAGERVWLRVGPSEPPAGVPAKAVRQMRAANQKVLWSLRKKFGARLAPVKRGHWDTPYHRVNE